MVYDLSTICDARLEVAKRRDVFVMVTATGRKDEVTKRFESWLEGLDGYPGFLGGSLLHETAAELPECTIVLTIDFEDAAGSTATFERLATDGTGWPFMPNPSGSETDDQSWKLFGSSSGSDGPPPLLDPAEALDKLEFDRGDGGIARLIHVHAEVAVEYSASGAS